MVITKERLVFLYHQKGMSSIEIGKRYGCHPMTVRNRIKELAIIKKTPSASRQKYSKKDFSGDLVEKAYLQGFSDGDMNIYVPPYLSSETVVARCHTTQLVQVKLIKQIFSQYGKVTVSKSRYGYNVNCFLNLSFSFLLYDRKAIPPWIKSSVRIWSSFVAGYVDAEGSFGLNQGKARFKVDSYDLITLRSIKEWAENKNIRVSLRQIAKKGQQQYFVPIPFNGDLWRLNINDISSINKFIDALNPFSKHETRKKQMLISKNNITARKLKS